MARLSIDIEGRLGSGDSADDTAAHRVWGGELRLRSRGKVRLLSVTLPPITLMKGEWSARARYRRPASMVRRIEQGFYRIVFAVGGRVINGGPQRIPDIEDRHLSIGDIKVGYTAELVPNPGETLSIIVVLVPQHLLVSCMVGSHQPSLTVPLDVPAAGLAHNIASFLTEHGDELPIPVRDKAVELFLAMMESCFGFPGKPPLHKPPREQRMSEIVRFVHDNIANADLSASAASEALGISRRYLSLLIQQHGTNFPQLVRKARVAVARELLVAAEMQQHQITRIGLMCGFKSPPHFARVFKNEMGVAPGAYRSGHKSADQLSVSGPGNQT
jgi:AraC-like DNA-binding protein